MYQIKLVSKTVNSKMGTRYDCETLVICTLGRVVKMLVIIYLTWSLPQFLVGSRIPYYKVREKITTNLKTAPGTHFQHIESLYLCSINRFLKGHNMSLYQLFMIQNTFVLHIDIIEIERQSIVSSVNGKYK